MLYALAPSKELLEYWNIGILAYSNLIKSPIVKNPANLFLIQASQFFLSLNSFFM